MKNKRIYDMAEFQKGFAFKSKDYQDNGVRIIRVSNLNKKDFSDSNCLYIDETKAAEYLKYELVAGDAVISTVGSWPTNPESVVGKVCIIPEEIEGSLLNQNAVRLRAKEGYEQGFLNYLLLDKTFGAYIVGTAQGSANQASITLEDIRNFEVYVPSIELQRKIVGVLQCIDRRIMNNCKINDNLLQQALCLYSSLIGERAKNGCIGDYCSIKSGFAFKSKWWQDSGVPVVKIGSINQDYLNLSDCSFVSDDKISYANDFIVSGGDLLIAMTGATIGKFTMVPRVSETILVNQRVGKFFLGEKPIEKLPFIYCTLKQPDIISEVVNRGQGSAQPNISATDIMTIPCVIPSTDELDQFNRELSPMFEMIINNQYENTALSNTRDIILPQLMSGELDVSDIYI